MDDTVKAALAVAGVLIVASVVGGLVGIAIAERELQERREFQKWVNNLANLTNNIKAA